MTFVASTFSDDVCLLDCSVVILQNEIYVIVLFWGVTVHDVVTNQIMVELNFK